jgi:hypothetical protein
VLSITEEYFNRPRDKQSVAARTEPRRMSVLALSLPLVRRCFSGMRPTREDVCPPGCQKSSFQLFFLSSKLFCVPCFVIRRNSLSTTILCGRLTYLLLYRLLIRNLCVFLRVMYWHFWSFISNTSWHILKWQKKSKQIFACISSHATCTQSRFTKIRLAVCHV